MTTRILTATLLLLISCLSGFSAIVLKDGTLTGKGGLAEKFLGKNIFIQDAEDGMSKAREQCEDGNVREAISLYKKVYTKYPCSQYAPEARFAAGQLLSSDSQKNYRHAFDILAKIITDFPNYPCFNEVIALQFEIASKLQCGARPYYYGFIPGFKSYDNTLQYFESIILNAPYTQYAPMALMNIADLARENKESEDAIDALERLISDYPESQLAPRAYLMLGDIYLDLVNGVSYDQGPTIQAMNYYEDFMVLYPKHADICLAEIGLANAKDKIARSKVKYGDFYYNYRNNCTAAKKFYSQAISIAPKTEAGACAEQQIEKINNGVLPRKTIVDRIFGRYKAPSTPSYLNDLEIEQRDNKEFHTNTTGLSTQRKDDEVKDYFVDEVVDATPTEEQEITNCPTDL